MIRKLLKIISFGLISAGAYSDSAEIFATGDISKLKVPKNLAYAGAIEKIKREAVGTGVTINLKNFYTEERREFHNFVSSITYRFIERDGVNLLAYIIDDKELYYLTYYEVDYSGKVIYSWSDSSLDSKEPSKGDIEGLLRANSVLGVFHSMALKYKP